jgi:hypothetical protein
VKGRTTLFEYAILTKRESSLTLALAVAPDAREATMDKSEVGGSLIDALGRLGKQGWELVSVVGDANSKEFFFKRQPGFPEVERLVKDFMAKKT